LFAQSKQTSSVLGGGLAIAILNGGH
jgi:hypothetical protein